MRLQRIEDVNRQGLFGYRYLVMIDGHCVDTNLLRPVLHPDDSRRQPSRHARHRGPVRTWNPKKLIHYGVQGRKNRLALLAYTYLILPYLYDRPILSDQPGNEPVPPGHSLALRERGILCGGRVPAEPPCLTARVRYT